MKKCLHVNRARPSEGRLTSVQFHPSAQVALTAGQDQSISLFQVSSPVQAANQLLCRCGAAPTCASPSSQVDGKTNPKIQSIHLERFPVHRVRFSRDGKSLFATSNRNKMFYIYHMMEGRVEPVHSIRGERPALRFALLASLRSC